MLLLFTMFFFLSHLTAIDRCVGGKDQLGQKNKRQKGPALFLCKIYQLFIYNVSVDIGLDDMAKIYITIYFLISVDTI